MPGYTGTAINRFMEVYGLIKGDKEKEKTLRARARSAPSLVASHGAAAALAFLLSKSSKEVFEKLVSGGKPEKLGNEEAGYTLYLYAIYRFLHDDLKKIDTCSDLECIAKEIARLDEESQWRMLEEPLLDFMVEFKKVAEALLEKEEGE